MYAQEPVRVNLKGLAIVFTLFMIALVLFMGASANNDLLWFLPFFSETPSRITVYQDGCSTQIFPGEKGFDEMMVAINQSLSQVDGYEHGSGLNQETIALYTTRWRAVEVRYPKRVKIHTTFRFGDPDTLFIPLSEYFARHVFGGINGDYWAGALRLKTIEPILRAAEQIRCVR